MAGVPDPEPSTERFTPRNETSTKRVAWFGRIQEGVISRAQLLECGLSVTRIHRWLVRGHLHPHPLDLPGVYLVGHTHTTEFGNLVAALLHAGPGGALSEATALWWWGLLAGVPTRIHICAPGGVRSSGRVAVHHPRGFKVVRYRRLPTVPVAQALREYAAHSTEDQVRQVLSEADYRGRLDLGAIHAELGRGRPGTARLRRQLARHEPRLAQASSRLERKFIRLCEEHGIPLPEINYRISHMRVDAVWPAELVAVELDGHRAHRSRAQLTRDSQRALHCRRHGFTHARYSEDQIDHAGSLVAADLLRLLTGVSGV